MAKLDRLEESGGDGQAVPPGGSETQSARAAERRRVERGIVARFGHAARFRHQAPCGIDEQAQHHVALDLLVVEPWWVLDRRIGVQGHRGLLIADSRSEEHTSELQSHSDLVCRLLL